jgi:hypothetical protein
VQTHTGIVNTLRTFFSNKGVFDILQKSIENVDSTNVYECPVYLTALRAVSASEAAKHLVGTITIPCSETESFWTTRSIAGILEVNE